jgi:hypothetical protein
MIPFGRSDRPSQDRDRGEGYALNGARWKVPVHQVIHSLIHNGVWETRMMWIAGPRLGIGYWSAADNRPDGAKVQS